MHWSISKGHFTVCCNTFPDIKPYLIALTLSLTHLSSLLCFMKLPSHNNRDDNGTADTTVNTCSHMSERRYFHLAINRCTLLSCCELIPLQFRWLVTFSIKKNWTSCCHISKLVIREVTFPSQVVTIIVWKKRFHGRNGRTQAGRSFIPIGNDRPTHSSHVKQSVPTNIIIEPWLGNKNTTADMLSVFL